MVRSQPGASSSACSLPCCRNLAVGSLCTGLWLAQQMAALQCGPRAGLSLIGKQAGARTPCTGLGLAWQRAAVQGSRCRDQAWGEAALGCFRTRLAQQRVAVSRTASSSGLRLTQRQAAPQTRPAHSLMCPPAICLAGLTTGGLHHHLVRCPWIRTQGTCRKH